jgi:hypothetical protein
MYGLLTEIEQIQMRIKELKLPPVKKDILKLTDAGPGVGCSNIEARYRNAEMARILNSDRVNRLHRARNRPKDLMRVLEKLWLMVDP